MPFGIPAFIKLFSKTMPRQPVISFRIDPDTFAVVEQVAASRGASVGGFAKEKLLEGLGEIVREPLEAEMLREELRMLKRQTSKGIELLARLICRDDPQIRSEVEEMIAAWVQREIPR